NGKWNPQFRQFIDVLASGRPVDDSFKQVFQTDYATIESELKDYIGRNSYPAQFVTFDEKLIFDAGMQTNPLSEAEVQYYLGDLLCRFERRNEGEEYLKRAISIDQKFAPAYAALGMNEFRRRRYAEAQKYLEQAVAASSQNHLAHYYYAFTLYRELFGEGQPVAEMPQERVKLLRATIDNAIRLAPDFPDSYHLLALVNMGMDENLGTAASALKRAMAISPGREDYIFTLGQLYLRQEKFAEARQTAESLARNGADPELRSRAMSLLETIAQIEQFKAQQSSMAARETPQPSSNENVTSTPPPPPVLRRRIEGETIKGMLLRVDCDDKGMTLTIKADDKIVKFNTNTPERVQFITYVQDVQREITCGPINPPKQVIVTYRSPTDAKSKFNGEPLAGGVIEKRETNQGDGARK